MRHKKQYLKTLITILIPTYNRPHLLKRALDYYDDFGVKLIVGDSSEAIFFGAQNYNCEYHHLPNMPIIEKWTFLIRKLSTPYHIFCTDDDLTIKSSIIKCLSFLENHPDYSCALGNILHFQEENKIELGYHDSSYWYICKQSNYNKKDPVERILENFKDTLPAFYAVSRTKDMKEMLASFLDYKLSSAIFYEFWNYFYKYYMGYIKILPILFTIRGEIPREEAKEDLNLYANLTSKNAVQFIQIISDHLSQLKLGYDPLKPPPLHYIMESIWNWGDPAKVKIKNKRTLRLKRDLDRLNLFMDKISSSTNDSFIHTFCKYFNKWLRKLIYIGYFSKGLSKPYFFINASINVRKLNRNLFGKKKVFSYKNSSQLHDPI